MSLIEEPTSGTDSPPYNDVGMRCGRCRYWLKPTYEQAFNLVRQQPINCIQCSADLQLSESDRVVLEAKLQRSARMGKLTALILGSYFLLFLVVSVYFGFFAAAPFPGFSGVMVLVGMGLVFVIKNACTDDSDHDFVLVTEDQQPSVPPFQDEQLISKCLPHSGGRSA